MQVSSDMIQSGDKSIIFTGMRLKFSKICRKVTKSAENAQIVILLYTKREQNTKRESQNQLISANQLKIPLPVFKMTKM